MGILPRPLLFSLGDSEHADRSNGVYSYSYDKTHRGKYFPSIRHFTATLLIQPCMDTCTAHIDQPRPYIQLAYMYTLANFLPTPRRTLTSYSGFNSSYHATSSIDLFLFAFALAFWYHTCIYLGSHCMHGVKTLVISMLGGFYLLENRTRLGDLDLEQRYRN